jgi:transcriptional regulator with XRE-family HTH domain
MADQAPTVLTGPNGTPHHVVLTWEAYQALLSARALPAGERACPAAVSERQAEGAAPVRAWREYRGLSQAELAARVGISRAYLAQIEAGERTGTVEVLARTARSLGCLIEDLIVPLDAETVAKLDRLAAVPDTLDAFIAAVAETGWTVRPAADRFSLVEHVCHLRDADGDAYRQRIHRILTEAKPALADFDGTRLAQERDYQRQSLRDAAAAFRRGRGEIVERLRGLSPAARRRQGEQEGIGEISIDGVIDMMLAHDSEHLDEVAELAGR